METGDQLDAEAFVVRARDHLDDRQAARDAHFLLVQGTDGDGVLGDEQAAGDVVTVGPEVLAAGHLDEFFELVVGREWLHRIVTEKS